MGRDLIGPGIKKVGKIAAVIKEKPVILEFRF